MKPIWFIFGQIMFVLALAACGVAVAAPKVAPTEAPVVTQVATVAPTQQPTPTEAPVITPVVTAIPTEKPAPTVAATSAGSHARDAAPDFSLPDSTGAMVHLADEIKMAHRAVVLVFYFDYT